MARRALVWCLGLAAMHCLKVASRDEMVTELPMSSPLLSHLPFLVA